MGLKNCLNDKNIMKTFSKFNSTYNGIFCVSLKYNWTHADFSYSEKKPRVMWQPKKYVGDWSMHMRMKCANFLNNLA